MIKRNKSAAERASDKQRDSRRLRTYAMMFACALVLVAGFFFAGRQHFSSMDYGMKNSKMRRQIDELEAKKRQLLLNREVALSPMEIKKAAKKSGMTDPAAVEGELAQVASVTKEKATPPQVSDAKSLVVKTVAVTATATAPQVASYQKNDKTEKPAKKVTMSAE